jgi:hypothetical protein
MPVGAAMLKFLRSPVVIIALVVSLTLTLALAAAVGLTLTKFSRALTEAVDARYLIHAADLRSSIETGINLGLSLEEISANVEAIVTSRIAVDAGILSISVTDAGGESVFSISSATQLSDDAKVGLQSLDLLNSFDEVAGRVAIRYTVEGNQATIVAAARSLGFDAAILAALAAALVFLTCLVVLTPIPRRLRATQEALTAPEGAGEHPPKGGMERAAAQAAYIMYEAMNELKALESELPDPPKREAG